MAIDWTDPNAPDPNADPNAADSNANVDPGTTDTSAAGDQFPEFGAGKDKALSVPQNILDWIQSAADATGVPAVVLAAVIHQRIAGRWTSLSPQIVDAVANRIAARADNAGGTVASSHSPGTRDPVASEIDWWLNVAADYGSGAAQGSSAWNTYRSLIQGFTTKAPTIAPDVNIPAGRRQLATFPGGVGGGYGYGSGGAAAKVPIIAGLTDDQAVAVQRVADTLFLKYHGRFPTVAEYNDISRKGFTAQQLEQHLRGQENPDAKGFTVGQTFDAQDLANKWANQVLGRDASAGEVNFLLTNKIPINDDHFSAFFDQIHDHAVWQGDPVKWRAMQARLQSQWNKLGLTGDVDPNTVNQALAGNWTDQQAAEHFRAMPAPGYAQGQTVGDIDRLRTIAASAKASLFPGEPVTDEDLKAIQGMSPDQILQHFRSIVPKGSQSGLPAGIESDYRALAESVLSKYGVTGYDLTPADLKFFALTKADPAAMLQHFADNPALAAAHPGLAFGMDSTQYKKALEDLQGAYGGVFPGQQLDAPRAGASAAERDNSLLGYALGQGISGSELSSVAEQFRQERGRAPTAAEFKERRNRPAQRPGTPGPSVQIAMPDTSERGTPRPAVGGRRAAA